uniref:Uncharacterized protein n=1 Tax=Tetranychus urticae TaxID=32264 RepID=T1KQF8_TETUR
MRQTDFVFLLLPLLILARAKGSHKKTIFQYNFSMSNDW